MLAARVQRHLRVEAGFVLGNDDLRRKGAVVERPQYASKTLLGELAYRRGDRKVSGGKFETHGCSSGLRLSNQAFRKLILVKNLPLIRRWNLQFLAIFCDGPARELETFALQDADDLRIAQRLSRILLLDDLADALLDGHRGHRPV